MNINENSYQTEILNQFEGLGWSKLNRNSSDLESQLSQFNESLLQDFLFSKYPELKNNEKELSQIFQNIKKITSSDWYTNNKNGVNLILKNGITTDYRKANGLKPYFLIDFDNWENNILNCQEEVWISYKSRMDIVLYINGLPIYIFELKSFALNKGALIDSAIKQISRYTSVDNEKIMAFNLGLVVSQSIQNTYIGSPELKKEFWFKPISNSGDIESLFKYFSKERIINNIKWGILFKKGIRKSRILLRPHQYESIIKMNETLTKREGGYVWHTQGSGKTITIAALIASFSHFKNNAGLTTVIDVDRTELVDNIYDTITSFDENNISTNIKKAKSSNDLKIFLSKADYRGVIVTTTQKFGNWGLVSEHNQILLLSDEAHRTHSTDEIKSLDQNKTYLEKIDEALPNSLRIGFTGTPIFENEKSTYRQFGKMLHKYTMKDAEYDGIITKIDFSFAEIPLKVSENADLSDINKAHLKSSRIANEAETRNNTLVNEISESFTNNKYEHKYSGNKDTYKAMVVTNSIAQGWIVYNKLLEKLPKVNIKFVATPQMNNQDNDLFNFLSKTDDQKSFISKFKEPDSDIEIMVVTDKLLTGYDVPNLRIMYLDKEIKDHNLLQTIARVNRKYENKDVGMIISFRNIKDELIKALTVYRETTHDNSETIKYIENSEYMFDEKINEFENWFELKKVNENYSFYINELAYEVNNLPEENKIIVMDILHEIFSISQIIYKIEDEIRNYKVKTLILLRGLIIRNEKNETFLSMTDEEFKRVLECVEVDGGITYSLSNKSIDEILELTGIIPPKQLLHKIADKVIKEIKENTDSKEKEKALLEQLKEIIDAYNGSLSSMKKFIEEVNKFKPMIEDLEEPSRWTKFFIETIKNILGEIELEQAKAFDEKIKEVADDWYSTELSQRKVKETIFKLLSSKETFGNVGVKIIDKIILEFIESSRREWINEH